MTGYVIRRLIGVVVVIFLLSFISFMLVNAFPGSTAERLLAEGAQGASLTEEAIEQYNRQLGLDRPVFERYGNWLWNAVQGNLGRSFGPARAWSTRSACACRAASSWCSWRA